MAYDRLQLRAQDYKSDWANALAVDLKESAELAKLMTTLSSELDDQRSAVLEIAQLLPKLLVSIEVRLSDTTDRLLDSIEETSSKVRDEIQLTGTALYRRQIEFLLEFEVQRSELEKARASLDTQRADIKRARLSLEAARAGFNQMGLIKRIFIRR